jgi:hypothetical protein
MQDDTRIALSSCESLLRLLLRLQAVLSRPCTGLCDDGKFPLRATISRAQYGADLNSSEDDGRAEE